MPRSTIRKFDETLDKLFADRTHWLKSLIRRRQPGAAPRFRRRRVEKSIDRLQGLATETLLSSNLLTPIDNFYDQKKQWHPKRGKGHGVIAKSRAFKKWYEEEIDHKNCVYVFWNGNRCLYVGRTLNGKGRPSSHFNKHWFSKAHRIDILGSSSKRKVPALECRLTHELEPSYSRIKPSRSKHFQRCQICEVEKHIRDEMKSIFALR